MSPRDASVAVPAGPSRWPHRVTLVALVLLELLQSWGRTTFDTKFDLTANPTGLLDRALSLWDPAVDFGGVQNQTYGYLFPHGAWFAAVDAVGLPMWLGQRMFSAALLVLAYAGARRLALALDLDGAVLPVLVGLGYALSPRILDLTGVLTGEMLPSAVLPWICLPLVLALRGRIGIRRAALLSGLAVLAMGGVNAVENLAVLPLPALLVLSAWRRPGGRGLAAWWAGATAAAAAWWMLPLLLLGRYSPPFLDYVESAATTTRTAGWSNLLRGSEHWLNYLLVGGHPWWPAATSASTDHLQVLLWAVVAGLGLFGLLHPASTWRGPFLAAAVLGALVMAAGHGGPAGTPFAGQIRALLDGPLAPFRNVHKADPLVRLPLALGLGVALRLLAEVRWARWLRGRLPGLAGATASVLVLVALLPAMQQGLRHPGWRSVPDAWREAATWIDSSGPGSTLVLPASGFGYQTWGWTVDEPLQPLTTSVWASRSQLPLTPPATIRFLDGVQQSLADGGSAGLAASLAAVGVTRLLVRNDLDPAATGALPPDRVAAALAASPGFERVAAFGSIAGADPGEPGRPLLVGYRVAPAGGASPPATSAPYPLPVLTGAPEDVITARAAGLVPPGGHLRVGPASGAVPPAIVTDGYRRVERQYGRVSEAVGQVLTATEPRRLHRAVPDYPGAAGVPRVVARYSGVDQVLASSSSGYPDTTGAVDPALGPASAVDGVPSSYWRSAPFTTAVGQWLELRFDRPRQVGAVSALVDVDGVVAAPVRRVEFVAGGLRRSVAVDPVTGRAGADLSEAGPLRAVRLRIAAIGGQDPRAMVAVREFGLAGVAISRTLVVPDVGAGASTSFVFATGAPVRACATGDRGPRCRIGRMRSAVEAAGMDRTFTLDGAGRWTLRGTAVALPVPGVAAMLTPLGKGIAARSDSVLGGDPAVSAQFAVDGDPTTAWLAASGATSARLELSWGTPRTVDRIRVDPALVPAVHPSTAVIASGDRTRTVRLTDGLGFFAPLRASSLEITFATGAPVPPGESLGVGEVRLDGIEDLAGPVQRNWRFSTPCGWGPRVTWSGSSIPTRVSGTLGAVADGDPLTWSACGSAATGVPAGPGEQHLFVAPSGLFAATSAVLDSGVPAAGAGGARPVEGTSGDGSAVAVRVGAGPATVLLTGRNPNPGWRAELDGQVLRPVVVDGWQQGFEVPAGAAGTIELRFAPARWYRWALIAGGAAAALLALTTLLVIAGERRAGTGPTLGRTPARRHAGAGRAGRAVLVAAGVLVLAAGAGPVPAAAALLGWWWVHGVAAPHGGAPGPRPRAVAIGAALAALVSGVIAAFAGGTASGVPGSAADLAGGIALGLAAGVGLALLGARASAGGAVASGDSSPGGGG